MEIVIINKSQLNNCWSALQYINNCDQCKKVQTCKIQSKNRLNGFKTFYENKKTALKNKFEADLKEINKQLNL